MNEVEAKKDELQDIFGYSELSDDDKKFLESAIEIIAMCETCTKEE